MQNDMSRDTAIVRQEEIRKLQPFCRALAEALSRRGLGPENALAAWRAGVAAECARCGSSVSGDELFALSQPPAAEQASARIGRLRLGDCARSGCDSYHYQLTFKMQGQVDWAGLLLQVETIQQEQEHPAGSDAAQRLVGSSLARLLWTSGRARRLWLALAAVLLLMLIRQWYLGGRIPLIREPEHFRVDPAPREEAAPCPPARAVEPLTARLFAEIILKALDEKRNFFVKSTPAR